MFPSFLKKSLVKRAALAGTVLVLLTGFFFVSCSDLGDDQGPYNPGGNPVSAQEPNITSQPAATNWNVSSETTKTLTVTVAEPTDGGTLSYQWYSNTTNSNSGGTAITAGGTGTNLILTKASFTMNIDYYFYVVVTNTNNNATVNKTATATSNVAMVTVTGNGGSAPEVVIPANINGYFQTPMSYAYGYIADDAFAVNATAKTFYYYFDSTLENYWGGNIVSISEDKSGDGGEPAIMIIQITGSHDSSGFMTLPTNGKYFAYAYKSLAGDIVSSAAPYKSSGKNTGVDTIAEAITEYTKANGYFDYYGTYTRRSVTAADLASLQGTWCADFDSDYIVRVQGTVYWEWYDDGDGIYDADDDEYMLGALGEIVDCTDTSQNSGILYIKVVASDIFTNESYIAVAWDNKNANSIDIATGNDSTPTLAEIKTTYSSTSDFPAASFGSYEK